MYWVLFYIFSILFALFKSYENPLVVILLCMSFVFIRALERSLYNEIKKEKEEKHISIYLSVFNVATSVLFIINSLSFVATSYIARHVPDMIYMNNNISTILGPTGTAIVDTLDILLFVFAYIQVLGIKQKVLSEKKKTEFALKPVLNSKILDVVVVLSSIGYVLFLYLK